MEYDRARPQDFEEAADLAEAWERVREIPARAAIIHYSQFELSFLKALGELPWPVICTYKLANRLYPDLPARSLRALSGHFGFELPEKNRARDHVAATRHIWKNLVQALKEKEKISTWEEFEGWWAKPPRGLRKRGPHQYLVDRELRLKLPDAPGVYEMYSRGEKLLYVGKATNLKDRVNSYFRQRKKTRTNLKELMTQVADLKVTPTETALEAALLENDRIKKHNPPYNISLKENARRLLFVSPCLTHFSEKRDAEHPWGPFTSHEVFEPLERLLCIQKGQHDLLDPILLNFPPEMTKQKLEAFLRQLGREDLTDLTLQDLLRAGRFAPSGDIDEETQDEEKLAEASVYRKLRHSKRRLHQAHSLAWLTECRAAWKVKGKGFRVIEIERGRVVAASYAKRLPRPGTYGKNRVTFPQRQKNMDVGTYDRMRVLGTELSTLAKKGIPVTVQVSSHRSFLVKGFLE